MIEVNDLIVRPFKKEDLEKFYVKFFQDFSILKKNIVLFDFLKTEYCFEKKFFEKGLFTDRDGGVLVVNKKNDLVASIFYYKKILFEGFILSFYLFDKKVKNFSKILKLFTEFLFSKENINRLEIYMPLGYEENTNIIKKSGFKFEGIKRRAFFHNGHFLDVCIFSKVLEDFNEKY